MTTLCGHRGSVNCLEIVEDTRSLQLLSGAEDKSIRFWDLRCNFKSQKCIGGCFDSSVTDLKLSYDNANLLFTSTETSLYVFDLRFESVLNRTPLHTFETIFDSVNSIALQQKQDALTAIADDSGNICILNYCNNSCAQNLLGAHSSIISSVLFNRIRTNELVSGGYDCCCHLWDLETKSKKSSVNFSDLSSLSEDKGQVFNPPFVSSLHYIHNCSALAIGLGDGRLRVHSSEDLQQCIASIDAHRGMITSIDNKENLIISGGVDRSIHFWEAVPVEKKSTTTKGNSNKKKKKKGKNSSVSNALKLCHSIHHGEKINVLKISSDHSSKLHESNNPKVVDDGKGEEGDEGDDEFNYKKKSELSDERKLGLDDIVVFVGDTTHNITFYKPELS